MLYITLVQTITVLLIHRFYTHLSPLCSHHAGNAAADICRDSHISIGSSDLEYTPYEHLRVGQPTRCHYGYCDLAADDTIAECTASDITDGNIAAALALLPDTIEVIFLNGNEDITDLPDDVFVNNLKNPAIIQALYLNDCSITNIAEFAFRGLPELKIFNADVNQVTTLPETLFNSNTKLMQLSMFFNPIAELPELLFRNTKEIERVILYGSAISKFEPQTQT